MSGEASPAPYPPWWDGQISTGTSLRKLAQALAGCSDAASAWPLLWIDIKTPSPGPQCPTDVDGTFLYPTSMP